VVVRKGHGSQTGQRILTMWDRKGEKTPLREPAEYGTGMTSLPNWRGGCRGGGRNFNRFGTSLRKNEQAKKRRRVDLTTQVDRRLLVQTGWEYLREKKISEGHNKRIYDDLKKSHQKMTSGKSQ